MLKRWIYYCMKRSGAALGHHVRCVSHRTHERIHIDWICNKPSTQSYMPTSLDERACINGDCLESELDTLAELKTMASLRFMLIIR